MKIENKMSITLHHAIIVTSCAQDDLKRTRKKAKKLGMRVTDIVESEWNGPASFLVVPDGSLEGWTPSYEGDKARRKLMKFCKNNVSVHAIEVEYGGDYSIGEVIDATPPNNGVGRSREENII